MQKKVKLFFIDWYYDICSWFINQKTQTVDYIVYLAACLTWNDMSWREGFYEYRQQCWKRAEGLPSYQDYVRYRLFG